MKRLQKVVKLLDAAIREEGASYLSIWSKKRYLNLFEYGPEGIGQIKPAEINPLFSIPKNTSPKAVEQALCAEFEIYEKSGFFKRLWWFFTKPVELYRKVYTLTHLRDLKTQYLSIKTPLDKESAKSNKALSYFALLKPLADYFKSYLPSLESINHIIRGQSMSVHKLMFEVFMKLKTEMELDYTGYLLGLMLQKSSNKLQENNLQWIEIGQWHASLKEELGLLTNVNSSDSYVKDFKALEVKLTSMYCVLSALDTYKYNPQINAFPISLNRKSDNKRITHTYLSLFQKIEHDCAVYINEFNDSKPKLESYTYTLTNNMGHWVLFYCDKDVNEYYEIPIDRVSNLLNLCADDEIDKEAIQSCIFNYHTMRVPANKKDNPRKRYFIALEASPAKQVEKLLCDYSLNISAKKIEANNYDTQQIIEELMYKSFIECEAKEPYINAYLAMRKRLKLQKTYYENIINLIETHSRTFQHNALRYVLENQPINDDTLKTHLETVMLPQHLPPQSLRRLQSWLQRCKFGRLYSSMAC